ncbi:restriction endonuclease subunit S [Lactiplantibacillus daoliensis]|uniref:Restriction endonuclease subunit S n=1 Tax=Lactiplantibacillus daoliensis TaxID=2559916 RepID=A0ABW1UKZ5_9LACO|nr:restriction endonuclease subunit S [Lactiplantibacillus daoliensis]
MGLVWEQRKAKEIFVPISQKGYPELQVLSVTQDNGVVFRDDLDIDIKYDKKSLSNYKVISPGDFVISLRSFQGGFELSDKLGISSPAYTIFNFKDPKYQNAGYWYFMFKRYNFIESLKTVTFGIRDGKSISFNEFSSLKLVYPTKKEQAKISNTLRTLDKLIAANECVPIMERNITRRFIGQKMLEKVIIMITLKI